MIESKRKQLEIIEDFYALYMRSPKPSEYKALGGTYKTSPYITFLAENYFKHPTSKEETYEVVDRQGKVVYTGIPKDIGYEYDTTGGQVSRACREKTLYKGKYTIRKKEFDINYFNKHRKDDLNGKID